MAIGSAVCRVCLAGSGGGEVKLLDINNQLLDVYEKLTNTKMSEGEGKLCYVCLSQLQRCWRFAKTARRSEQYLKAVLDTDKEIKGDTFNNMLKLVKLQTLSVNKLKPLSLESILSTPKKAKNKGKYTDNGYFLDDETNKMDEQIILIQVPDLLGKETHINREITKINEKNIKDSEINKNEDDFEDEDLSEVKDCIIITKMYYECDVCDKILESQQELAVHQKTHAESESKQPIEEIKEIHMPVTTELKPDKVITKMFYECGGCSKILQSQEELAIHQNSHTEPNSFHHHLLSKSDIAENINEATKLKAVNCSVCRKYFNDTAQLYQHVKMHTGKRPFICDTCGKTFRTRCHLKAHISIHTMEKVYCKICNKGFSQTSSLGRHMLIHTGEFRFFCHICGRKCKQSGQLRMHIRTVHEGIKDHECEICNKRFSVNAELQRHMVCHAGIKAFECEDCGIKVSTKTVLRRHKKSYCKKVLD